MIDLDQITRNVAADLCRRFAPSPKTVETLVRDAFRRGLQLGLSLRAPRDLNHSANDAQPDIQTPTGPMMH